MAKATIQKYFYVRSDGFLTIQSPLTIYTITRGKKQQCLQLITKTMIFRHHFIQY